VKRTTDELLKNSEEEKEQWTKTERVRSKRNLKVVCPTATWWSIRDSVTSRPFGAVMGVSKLH
jgi:hypothetical protein